MKTHDLTTCSLLRVLSAAAGVLVISIGAARAADYPSTIIADSPSAYYRLEETSGNGSAADSSGNQNSGYYIFNTAGSPLQGEPGIDTNSILFTGPGPGGDGDFGEVAIPASPLIVPVAPDGIHSGPFSAELWVQPTVQPTDYEVPLEVGAYPKGWNFYVSPGPGTSYFILNMPNGVFFSSFGAPIQFLNWYHLVLTYDGTNETFYINGVSTGTYAAALVPATSISYADVGSGQQIYSQFEPFLGGVDEVAFYDYVLPASKVATHYAVGTNSFRPSNAPAGILSGPSAETQYSGLPVTFSVSASGTPPLHYIWLSNSVPVGPDANAFTFTAEYPGNNNANIAVVVSNAYGPAVTSSVVQLTVSTSLNIVSPPGSITRNVGSHAAFHVTANGAVPITYQWSVSSNGGGTFAPISSAKNPTATNQTLWLSNVQLAQNDNIYSVAVTNPFTSSSQTATLNVVPRSDPAVPLTGYGAIIAADNPVAYWRLDETSGSLAEDAVGSFDGAYTPNSGTIGYGATTGIPHCTDPAVTLGGTPGGAPGGTIQVPFAPELNPDTAWSVETWVQPSSLGVNGNDYRVVLSSEYNQYPYPFNGWYLYQQAGANNFAFVPEPGNGFITSGSPVVPGNWYHVVIVDDTTNFYLYVNGALGGSFPVSGDPFIPNGDGINPNGTPGLGGDDGGNFVIGQRTDAAFGTFLGTVDDTALYQYALSPQQVLSHYSDAALLTIRPAGSNVILTWPVGALQESTNVLGTYTNVIGATSPYTNAASGTANYFRVHVP